MKTNPNQLSFDFNKTDLAICQQIECDHDFYTDDFTEHEVCRSCGLCVPHEYITETYGIEKWDAEGM